MSDQAHPPNWDQYEKAYREAGRLSEGLIVLHGRPVAPLSEEQTGQLREAARLYEEAIRLMPRSWPAMWLLGKVHERLGDRPQSLYWFDRAFSLDPKDANVGREACLAALDLDMPNRAVGFARGALTLAPDDPGLRANLALALLFSDQPEKALPEAEAALARDPADEITANIVAITREVLDGKRPCPHHVRDLE